ncbi:MAG: hypothetical protein HGA66_14540, partial [Holophaga sp.]|nr:hypothetical protein [Holophaga sp.]
IFNGDYSQAEPELTQIAQGVEDPAMLYVAGGANWVSLHHGGGVGMGYSQHSGVVIVADGTERADRCIRRVLWNDPAMGVFRHADAGYESAREHAGKIGLHVPMG